MWHDGQLTCQVGNNLNKVMTTPELSIEDPATVEMSCLCCPVCTFLAAHDYCILWMWPVWLKNQNFNLLTWHQSRFKEQKVICGYSVDGLFQKSWVRSVTTVSAAQRHQLSSRNTLHFFFCHYSALSTSRNKADSKLECSPAT